MRATTLLEVVGLVLAAAGSVGVTVAAGMVALALAWLVAGVQLLTLGVVLVVAANRSAAHAPVPVGLGDGS